MTDIVSVTSEFRLLLAAGWSGTSQSLWHQKQCQINTITTHTPCYLRGQDIQDLAKNRPMVEAGRLKVI